MEKDAPQCLKNSTITINTSAEMRELIRKMRKKLAVACDSNCQPEKLPR